MVFWIVVDPLAFSSAVFLTPPVFFSVLVFVDHSTVWLYQNPGWEVPDVCWLSLSGIPVEGVVFLR